jgi:hypothetical protein
MAQSLRFQLSALCSQLLALGGRRSVVGGLRSLVFCLWPAVCRRPSTVVSARVAELADALDLGSSGETLESSSLSSRTTGLFFT